MKRFIISILLLFGVFQPNANAQQKLERESRLKSADVPRSAMQFIDAVELETRWKWYFEENLTGNSVEAKTKHQGKWYSVEFDTSGNIQDVEVETDLTEIREQVGRNIVQGLDSMFNSHKIDKIQIQYTADSPILLGVLNNKSNGKKAKIQYEIVVKGKKTGRPKLYELTFSEKGKLLFSEEIIFKNTNNLEF